MYKHNKVCRTIYDSNTYRFDGDICFIGLFNKDGKMIAEVKVDKDDYPLCKKYKWSIKVSRTVRYAMDHVGKRKIFMHRLILGYEGNSDVDHVNHDGLDNRKHNLRVISHSANGANSRNKYSGIKLVKSGRYQCVITYNYKGIYLGTFDTKEEALKARNEKLMELHGFTK